MVKSWTKVSSLASFVASVVALTVLCHVSCSNLRVEVLLFDNLDCSQRLVT